MSASRNAEHRDDYSSAAKPYRSNVPSPKDWAGSVGKGELRNYIGALRLWMQAWSRRKDAGAGRER